MYYIHTYVLIHTVVKGHLVIQCYNLLLYRRCQGAIRVRCVLKVMLRFYFIVDQAQENKSRNVGMSENKYSRSKSRWWIGIRPTEHILMKSCSYLKRNLTVTVVELTVTVASKCGISKATFKLTVSSSIELSIVPQLIATKNT